MSLPNTAHTGTGADLAGLHCMALGWLDFS